MINDIAIELELNRFYYHYFVDLKLLFFESDSTDYST